VNRREVIAALGGATAPLLLGSRAVRAQQPPLIGYLHNQSPESYGPFVAAFRQGCARATLLKGRPTR